MKNQTTVVHRNEAASPYPWWNKMKFLLSGIYILLLVYIVFLARRRRGIHKRDLNLIPLKRTVHDYFYIGQVHGGRWNFYTNLLGNVFLFIPLAFVIMSYGKTRNVKAVVLTGMIVSCCIETIQYIFEIGFADVDDVILNTLGMFIGAWLYLQIKKRRAFYHYI